ncbi:MAG: hypothetical protein EOO37_00045 [Cytophagaceae bacterium]|nr:MAG: hypothetical protein EOO37_00045 [Cytophagaceae bacterium]
MLGRAYQRKKKVRWGGIQSAPEGGSDDPETNLPEAVIIGHRPDDSDTLPSETGGWAWLFVALAGWLIVR